MNKKGNVILVIGFFALLFLIMMIGFILAIGGAVLNFVADETHPTLANLGVIGSANMTDIASYTITPVNTFVQQSTWLTGILYVLMLVGSIIMVVAVRLNPSRLLIGVYFTLVVVLVMGSILLSNIYEDFYDDAGDLGDRGILMFSGIQQEEFG
jgi:hypothetical protein